LDEIETRNQLTKQVALLLENKREIIEKQKSELQSLYERKVENIKTQLDLEKRNSALEVAFHAHQNISAPLQDMIAMIREMQKVLSISEIEKTQKYLSRIDSSTVEIKKIIDRYNSILELSFENYTEDTVMVKFHDEK
jgi:hypothetical protein